MSGKKQLPPLRIATLDDAPTPHKSLRESIENGSRLDEMLAIRRILVAHIESENILARDLAALTNQLRSISKEIEGLEARAAEEDAEGADDANGSADARWEPEAI